MFTKLGLLTTGFVFIQLGLGMRLAKQYDGAANLFFYFALTIYWLLRYMLFLIELNHQRTLKIWFLIGELD